MTYKQTQYPVKGTEVDPPAESSNSNSLADYVAPASHADLKRAAIKAHDELLRWHSHSGHPDHPAEIALRILSKVLKTM